MTTVTVPTESNDVAVSCSLTGGCAELHVSGDLDAYTAISVRRVLDECLRQPVERIVCNLADVEFLDSGGLGLLVSSHRRAEAAHIEFVVTEPTPTVRRVFEITGMTRLLGEPSAA